jgi:hypothetical protein
VSLFAARTLRVASIVVCAIAALSFLLFALNQTSTASGQQQEALASKPTQTESKPAPAKESSFHSTIDEIADETSSPVAGLSSSGWAEHGLRLIFVLLVFGFGLGFLARVIRVRS